MIVLVVLPKGPRAAGSSDFRDSGVVAVPQRSLPDECACLRDRCRHDRSLFAGHLAQVADVSVLTRRREHADALNERGLRITGRSDLEAHVLASVDPAGLPDFDLGIIACKGTDLDAVCVGTRGAFPKGDADDGPERPGRRGDRPSIRTVAAHLGDHLHERHTAFGHRGRVRARHADLARSSTRTRRSSSSRRCPGLIESSGLKAEAFSDLRPAQWSKLIFNATVNGVAALTELPHDFHFAADEEYADLGRLVRALMNEGKAVAAGTGVDLHDNPWEMNVHATKRGSAHRPSMLEDVEGPVGRRRSSRSTGRSCERRSGSDFATPLQRTVYALVRGKQASYS